MEMEASSMQAISCCKKRKSSSSLHKENKRLIIPPLPNDISIEILARLPRSCYLNVKLVCRCWKAAIISHELMDSGSTRYAPAESDPRK